MTWPDRIIEFFKKIEEPFSEVLCAHGCREGWLQGELFRYFRTAENGFVVNCACSGNRVRHDVHCKLPTEMLAELKVYPKNFHGPTRTYLGPLTGKGRLSREEIENVGPKNNSFLADVLRLMQSSKHLERYMILVIEKKGNEQ